MEFTGTITIGNIVVPYCPAPIFPGAPLFIDADNRVAWMYTCGTDIVVRGHSQSLPSMLGTLNVINTQLKADHLERVARNLRGALEVRVTLRSWYNIVAPLLCADPEWHMEKLEILDEFDPCDEEHIDFNALGLIALSVDDIGEPQAGKRTVAPGLLGQNAFLAKAP